MFYSKRKSTTQTVCFYSEVFFLLLESIIEIRRKPVFFYFLLLFKLMWRSHFLWSNLSPTTGNHFLFYTHCIYIYVFIYIYIHIYIYIYIYSFSFFLWKPLLGLKSVSTSRNEAFSWNIVSTRQKNRLSLVRVSEK